MSDCSGLHTVEYLLIVGLVVLVGLVVWTQFGEAAVRLISGSDG